MQEALAYINQLDPSRASIMSQLHHELMSNPGVITKIRYKVPFYFRKSWFCYLNPLKPKGVEMAFIRGRELSNDEGILLAKDRKMVRGIELFDPKQIPWSSVRAIVQEALLLDETVPYSIRNKS